MFLATAVFVAAAAGPNYSRLFLILPTGRSDTKCFMPFDIILKRIDCIDLLVWNAHCYQNVWLVYLINESKPVTVRHTGSTPLLIFKKNKILFSVKFYFTFCLLTASEIAKIKYILKRMECVDLMVWNAHCYQNVHLVY